MIVPVLTSKRTVSALVAVTALLLAGCSDGGPPEPHTTAQQFVDAVNGGNAEAAAALTTDPAAAAAALAGLYNGLSAGGTVTATPDFTVEDTSAEGGTITLDATWRFSTTQDGTEEPDGEPKQWQYDTTATATETDQGWRIDWDPAVLAPTLAADSTIRFTPTDALVSAKVFDRAGGELMSQQVVNLVNVDATADPAAVAALLTPIVPTITAQSIAADVAGAQGKTGTLVSLRASDVDPIAAQLAAMPGVTLAPQARLLTTDRALASPALNGISELWQQQLDANKGWSVQSVKADGSVEPLAGIDAQPAPDIATTLDSALQIKAENALASLPQQAAIVALQPSTGNVLAVAQNAAADAEGPIALTGLYPPGSTFKTVTTSAALEAGTATPDTILPCPGTENIEGRQIPNDDNFDLGDIPLHTAFARSCNTTMGRLGVGLPADGLQQTALQYGLGVDYVTPGLTSVTGNVPLAATPAQRVESAIGQGQVTASPFGMALVASSIASGALKAPTLLDGQPGVANATPKPVDSQVAEQVKAMMRETVTNGTATQLQDIPGLLGKTGTAEFGPNNEIAHGWFVGIAGDLAFAVFVAGGQSSGPALEAAGRLLR
ncbi:penicillin-binding transpeptidase domain-containing protein [Rhodococcus sp. H29-C3]|uniref:penicillin-binding transpeptidase domain-containing protein n=1 Tax=Rhodococcus sp. H29-C3 TaxID=3046307 RepID=UPI0024BB0BFD|nr:penicillin-binding transpeptidase domain-containing protein [Rhodococcus sp. H29-C3]MDJ0359507.1 penicillin-binding transpeptidase domain-containing protein [Rhodococcus sp. H29-C3]